MLFLKLFRRLLQKTAKFSSKQFLPIKYYKYSAEGAVFNIGSTHSPTNGSRILGNSRSWRITNKFDESIGYLSSESSSLSSIGSSASIAACDDGCSSRERLLE